MIIQDRLTDATKSLEDLDRMCKDALEIFNKETTSETFEKAMRM